MKCDIDDSDHLFNFSPEAQCPGPHFGGTLAQLGQIHNHHL